MIYSDKLEQLCRTNNEIWQFNEWISRMGKTTFLYNLLRMTQEEALRYYTVEHYYYEPWVFEQLPWKLFYEEALALKKYKKKDYLRRQPKEQLDAFYVARLSLEEALKRGVTKRQWLRYRIEYLNLKREAIEEYKSKEKVRR